MRRLDLAVGLLSTALIAFQLVLMHLLSIVQWDHFAYMIISVALLGFGASGALLVLVRGWLLARFARVLPLLLAACGAAMALVVGLAQQPFARFDAYVLFADASHLWGLLASYLLFFTPFLLGALALGLVFVRHARTIGRLYAANLVGSAAGGLLFIALPWLMQPEALPGAVALCAVTGAALVLPRHRMGPLAAVTLATVVAAGAIVFPPALVLSPYKGLSQTLRMPEAKVIASRSSPFGLAQVVTAPALRHAPGLSLTYTKAVPPQAAIFHNGDWFGAVTAWSRTDTTHLLDYTTHATPYVLRAPASVLSLGAGTGEAVAQAIVQGATAVDAVEPNASILSLLRTELAPATDSLLFYPAVTVHTIEPRTYLAASDAHYDLVLLPSVGEVSGTSGLYALQEQYLLTKPSLHSAWERLTPEGAVSVTAWMDYPYRNPLRTLATLVEVLEEQGIAHPADHLVAVRSWGTITFVMTRAPLKAAALERVRRFCDRLSFDPVLLPGLAPGETSTYNRLQDERFFAYVDQLLGADRAAFYRRYDYRITPTTDDRPFFFQHLRWQRLPSPGALLRGRSGPLLETGYAIATITFIQCAVLTLLLIFLPLLRLGWQGSGKLWTLLYFGGLGLGFLFTEIVLIQRFTLYLGQPMYATAAVLATLLLCSGLGSFASGRLPARGGAMASAPGAVAGLLLLYALALPWVLQASLAWPLPARTAGTLLLIAPLGFAMGFPFPLGLRQLDARVPAHVPWAWGINGAVSVLSTVLATLLSVELGFTVVLLLAGASYTLVAGASLYAR